MFSCVYFINKFLFFNYSQLNHFILDAAIRTSKFKFGCVIVSQKLNCEKFIKIMNMLQKASMSWNFGLITQKRFITNFTTNQSITRKAGGEAGDRK